jgi:peptidoglycan/xylan/chitin deacetylase (PgdA/CDA1 family)
MSFIHRKSLGFFVKTNGLFSKTLFGGIGHVFMLHRINTNQEREEYIFNKDLIITPEFLEAKFIFLKRNNYDFISLDKLYSILLTNKRPKRKFICFTFDDGYKDNLDVGLPLFEKYNIPLAIYVANSFPNRTANLWWYWLEELILANEFVKFENQTYNTINVSEKSSTYNLLRTKIKNLTNNERTALSQNLFDKSTISIQNELDKLALSWSELNDLQKHPLVTIGAHTLNHLSLANIPIDDMKEEIRNGKLEMEDKLNHHIHHFAYPYGGLADVNMAVVDFVSSLNFKTATLNHPGNIFRNSRNNTYMLPRYPLGNNTTQEQFNNYLNGIKHFSVNGWSRRINTL